MSLIHAKWEPKENFMLGRFKSLPGLLSAPLLILMIAAAPAWAASIKDLRASGAAGESFTGYAVARDAGAKADVAEVNAQRRALYTQKAGEQGVSVDQVGRVYAEQIFAKLPPGSWFQQENGQWIQK